MDTGQDPEVRGAVEPKVGRSTETSHRFWRRRRYQVVGALGVAVAIGVAALVGQHMRHRPVQPGAAKASSGDPTVMVTSSGSLPTDHHTLRVVSARTDLSGQRELAWAADAGYPVGDVRCTQNFRFNPKSTAGERPTMLVCWRTSAQKSVYTVAVDIDHRPSAQASAATIDTVWSKLG